MRRFAPLAAAVILAMGGTVLADEGMWAFNNLPKKHLKERHGFDPPSGWVEHLRGSAVRFNNGGSGSFVSDSHGRDHEVTAELALDKD